MAKAHKQVHKRHPVRSAIINWLGKPLKVINGEFWSQWAGGVNNSGQVVNERTLLSLSAGWACTRLISETISTLPLKVYRRTPQGRAEAPEHPLYSILTAAPNSDTTAAVHFESTTAAMMLRGAAWWEKLYANDRLVGVQYLDWRRLTWSRLPSGRYQYAYKDPVTEATRRIPAARIMYLPGFSLDGRCGVSVLEYGANVFGNALSADEAAGRTFRNGLMPTTYLKTDRVLKESQRRSARKYAQSLSGSMHAGDQPILEGGMTMGTIGIDPKVAQLLESRGYSAAEVCSWFRVPAWMVGVANGNQTKWGSGLEQELIAFLTFTLRPWLRRYEQSITKDLLAPAERTRYFVAYDVRDLLTADTEARSAFYSAMITHSVLTPDEAREMENLPTMGGNAAKLMVQGAMVPLDSTGTADAAARAKLYADKLQAAVGGAS